MNEEYWLPFILGIIVGWLANTIIKGWLSKKQQIPLRPRTRTKEKKC